MTFKSEPCAYLLQRKIAHLCLWTCLDQRLSPWKWKLFLVLIPPPRSLPDSGCTRWLLWRIACHPRFCQSLWRLSQPLSRLLHHLVGHAFTALCHLTVSGIFPSQSYLVPDRPWWALSLQLATLIAPEQVSRLQTQDQQLLAAFHSSNTHSIR